MKTHSLPQMLAFASLAFIAGCTTVDSRLGPNSRAGYISEFYSAEKLRTSPPACLASLVGRQSDEGKYVEIKIRHGRRNEYLSAFVPPSVKVELRDEVEFSPKHCAHGAVPEVIQVLKRHS